MKKSSTKAPIKIEKTIKSSGKKYKNKNISQDYLPDVASEKSYKKLRPIDWVGMEKIELPVRWETEILRAQVSAFVSLNKSPSRGIHMSRLYLDVQNCLSKSSINSDVLKNLLKTFLSSHEDLSTHAKIGLDFHLPIKRESLKSQIIYWKVYPVKWLLKANSSNIKQYIQIKVAYSSTCPASAALSRQINQAGFVSKFTSKKLDFENVHRWLGEQESVLATPHAQRSYANIIVKIEGDLVKRTLELIDLTEQALQTPVQGAVKRLDEQEFAKRNAENLMFCEDAIRKLMEVFSHKSWIKSYRLKVHHLESLHGHNAVSQHTCAE